MQTILIRCQTFWGSRINYNINLGVVFIFYKTEIKRKQIKKRKQKTKLKKHIIIETPPLR